MAGSPPPYPPPGAPYGFDPKQQARLAREQVKAQIRAQQAAYRAQRDLYRYQTRAALLGNRRSSILGPLIIVAIGVILLLLRIDRIPLALFWDWYGRWWPMLLVGAGVILVVEWAFDQIPRQDGVPYVRRGIGGGAIFLLLLLALTGAVARGILGNHDLLTHGFSINPENFDEIFGDKHEMSQSLDNAFPAGTSLAIDNPHGDVIIVGKSGDNMLHITVNKQVYSSTDSGADSKAGQLSPRIFLAGNTLNVTLPALDGATSDLSITVPDYGEITVNANHGNVTVSGIHAPVNITANHGDIEVSSIAGSVSAHINRSDDSFTAHQIAGDVFLHGHAEDFNVTDVSGQVSLEGEFYGDGHLERLHGPVSFRTSRTQLSLARLDGELDISPHSELTGNQIVGPTMLRTRSRNIAFDRITGDVDVVNRDGSVDVTGAPPLGNVSIENQNGEVTMTVPEHSGFSVNAETKGGEIENDLDLKQTTHDNRAALIGTVAGGGPSINIRTTHLDIDLRKKPEAPLAPPAPPAPPAAPKPPAKPLT